MSSEGYGLGRNSDALQEAVGVGPQTEIVGHFPNSPAVISEQAYGRQKPREFRNRLPLPLTLPEPFPSTQALPQG